MISFCNLSLKLAVVLIDQSLPVIILSIFFSMVLCRMKMYEMKKLDAMALGSLTQIPLMNTHGNWNGVDKM